MAKEITLEELLFSFVDEIERFQYMINYVDHIWDVLFPTQDNKWNHLRIV